MRPGGIRFKEISDVDWLAGLWEGEGCWSPNKGAKSRTQAHFRMVDFPVVRQAIRVAGNIGNIGVYKKPGCKPIMVWSINRYEEQIALLSMLCGRLFRRRHERICELWNTYVEYRTPSLSLPWLAGIVEAEGYMAYNGSTPCLRIGMTDLDVLEGIQEFVGLGSVLAIPKREAFHKDNFRWSVYGDNARRVLEEIYPLMSNRRRSQIVGALR